MKPITLHSNGSVRVERQLAHDVEGRAHKFFRAQLGEGACKPITSGDAIKWRILQDTHFSRNIIARLEICSRIEIPACKGIYIIDSASFKLLEKIFPLEDEKLGFDCDFWNSIYAVFPLKNARPASTVFDLAFASSKAGAGGMRICAFSRALEAGSLSYLDYAILSQLAYQRYWETYLASGASRLALGKDGMGGYGYAPFLFNIFSFEHEIALGMKTTLVLHDAFIGTPHTSSITSLDPSLGQLRGNCDGRAGYFLGDGILALYVHLARLQSIRDSDIDAAAMALLRERGHRPVSLIA
jgi:hypothetical protein